jgi:hypothetical protein
VIIAVIFFSKLRDESRYRYFSLFRFRSFVFAPFFIGRPRIGGVVRQVCDGGVLRFHLIKAMPGRID